MRKNEAIDLENLKIVIRFVDKDFSRYTLFVPLFKFSKSFLGLEDKFSNYLKLRYKSRLYLLSKIANLVNSLICCGVNRFVRLDNEFKIEKGLAKSLGFPKGFPSSDTIYRFFKVFNGYNIRQLEFINLLMLKEQKEHWYPNVGPIFVDLDMNTKSVEGKKFEKAALGYNRKSPGRLSLNWTVGHIAKVALCSQLHSGTTSGIRVLRDQVEHLEKLMVKLGLNPQEPRFIWRVDGGYFSWQNLFFLNKRRFLIRLRVDLKVLKPWLGSKKTFDNLSWKKYTKASYYVDLGKVNFPEVGNKGTNLRIVLIKTYKNYQRKKGKRKKLLLYPLCSNLFDWKTRSIVKAYRGRQILENCFRDTNQAFYSNKLPTSNLHGNQAFLWFICLAYNQFFFFQKLGRGQKT